MPSYVDDSRYTDLQIAHEWRMTIAEWDSLLSFEVAEYRRYNRAKKQKTVFSEAMIELKRLNK